MNRWAALGLLALVAACASPRGDSQRAWERGAIDTTVVPREAEVVLPAYPEDSDLIELGRLTGADHIYYIDAKGLSVGNDGVVRYSLVMKTAGGAVNVSHEGIRCATREKRIYALGQRSRAWIEAKRAAWEPIRAERSNEYQATLYTDYFCVERTIVRDREAALRALRSGGTPLRVMP